MVAHTETSRNTDWESYGSLNYGAEGKVTEQTGVGEAERTTTPRGVDQTQS